MLQEKDNSELSYSSVIFNTLYLFLEHVNFYLDSCLFPFCDLENELKTFLI